MSNISLPLEPSLSVKTFHVDDIIKKDSATSPHMIPCTCTTRNDPPLETKYVLLYKPEDIRKDQIVIDLFRLCNTIFEKEGNETIRNCKLLTYNILPTSTNTGMLEIVQSSVTFYDLDFRISEGEGICQFIMDQNLDAQITSREIYKTLICSAAASCVISLLLNFGDRHLDNIMVTSKGEFFHIDFGFILGEEPTLKNVMPKNLIRMPKKVKNLIGKISKNTLQMEFPNLTAEIYTILRRHYVMFMNLLILLHLGQPKIPFQFGLKYIEDELSARFLPGTPDKDAKEIFEQAISNSESLLTFVTDFGHHVKRQRAFDRFTRATNDTFKKMLGILEETLK